MAEIFGTSEAAIQRLGRWNNSALTPHYLTHLPREALRALAGFTREAGQFYLVRSTVTPPEELLKKVFFQVDYWIEKINKEEVLEGSTAADGIFKSACSTANLNHALENTEEPGELLLQRAIPKVGNHLKDLKHQVFMLSAQVRSLNTLLQGFQAFPADIF
ncbi:hypothetical protein [Parasitella parasitica]|uniref:Ndc10 domain-containing protein n=1 Tax=Parasitella parasitica TaxID=35722 RepID=A0A0B7N6Z9_9FUNG|nr:hypothetical protein [Parasitella parasitica]